MDLHLAQHRLNVPRRELAERYRSDPWDDVFSDHPSVAGERRVLNSAGHVGVEPIREVLLYRRSLIGYRQPTRVPRPQLRELLENLALGLRSPIDASPPTCLISANVEGGGPETRTLVEVDRTFSVPATIARCHDPTSRWSLSLITILRTVAGCHFEPPWAVGTLSLFS